jgi:SAM-dependent methyltransferase
MRALDEHLGTLEHLHRPEVILTDFAYEDPGPGKVGTPAIKMPEEPLENINLKAVTCDMFHVPLETNSVDVLYENLGALWHASDLDRRVMRSKSHVGEYTQRIIDEYKRIVAPGGKIIIDMSEQKEGIFYTGIPSTAEEVSGHCDEKGIKHYFETLGFETEVVGGDDGRYLLLTNPTTRKK